MWRTHRSQLAEEEAQLLGLAHHALRAVLALLSAAEGDALLHDGPQVLLHRSPVRLGDHPLWTGLGQPSRLSDTISVVYRVLRLSYKLEFSKAASSPCFMFGKRADAAATGPQPEAGSAWAPGG